MLFHTLSSCVPTSFYLSLNNELSSRGSFPVKRAAFPVSRATFPVSRANPPENPAVFRERDISSFVIEGKLLFELNITKINLRR